MRPAISLRHPRPDDAAALEALVSDPAVALPTAAIPHPYPPGGAAAHLADLARRQAGGLEHAFAIIAGIAPETAPGTAPLIGMITLRPDIDDGDGRTAELGYVLGRDWWGQGIATAAGRKVLVIARDQLALARLAADVKHDTHRSAAVLHHLGFTETGRRMKHWPARGGMVLVRQFVLNLG
jgi:RimJ/RimL family protein N-acetyltransferase